MALTAMAMAGCGQRDAATAPAANPGNTATLPATTAPLPLIPAPAEARRGTGSFRVGTGTVISIPTGNAGCAAAPSRWPTCCNAPAA